MLRSMLRQHAASATQKWQQTLRVRTVSCCFMLLAGSQWPQSQKKIKSSVRKKTAKPSARDDANDDDDDVDVDNAWNNPAAATLPYA